MKYAVSKTLAAAAGFCLIFGLLCTVICSCAVSRSFYYGEYEKLGVAEDIGISSDELKNATDVLLDFTEAKRADMTVYADIHGENKPVFNEREYLHMVDVRKLFLTARLVGYAALIAGAVGLALIAALSKDRRGLFSGYLLGNAVFLGVVAALAVYAAVDFYSFWTNFHHVFFTNDLWLLDPSTDNLILMVPQQFFSDLVFKIIGIFVACAAALALASTAALRREKKKRLKNAV